MPLLAWRASHVQTRELLVQSGIILRWGNIIRTISMSIGVVDGASSAVYDEGAASADGGAGVRDVNAWAAAGGGHQREGLSRVTV
jgi:hypothetical protein